MTPLPNLRHLIAALEVHRLGSVSHAARRVHLSQSAVTQGLAKLERELALTLFTRTPSGLFATEAGLIFLRRAERAVNWLKALDGVLGARQRDKPRHLHRLLTTTQLRALITVVEEGSYTLAANRLQLTQPTVHRAVRELESVCEQTFFQRSPAGVEPSWQARQVARYANLYFSELSQGLDEVSEHEGHMNGNLRVGSLPLARTRMVPHAVTLLLQEFPAARVSIIDGPYEEQLHSLLQGQLDVIVGALRHPTPSPDITQQLLFRDPLNVVVRAGHPLANKTAFTAAELQQLDWIAPRLNTPARDVFARLFENAGLNPPEHVIECSSLVATRGLLLESDRAALLPARQVEVEVARGLLVVNPQILTGTSRDIGLALRKQWLPTRVQTRFLELLRSEN
ncbi:MAG: LysR family transcriptional regulator [Gammaproteobacteria bacterium]|nr:LysR family transcriptional regulator [Gammaproteobacteria bacterium]